MKGRTSLSGILVSETDFPDPHMIGLESSSNTLTGVNTKPSEILEVSLIAAAHLHTH